MTGHAHEPFNHDASAASRVDVSRATAFEATSHRRMWIAVGATMAAIVALWVVLLPTIVADRGAPTMSEADRFASLRMDEHRDAFNASAVEARQALEAAARALEEEAAAVAAAATHDDPYTEDIQRLRERLDQAAIDAPTTEQQP